MMWQIFKRDFRLALRRPGDALSYIGFFVMIATLFPLALGPSPEKLALVTSSIIWIAVLLAAIPSFERLYAEDEQSGLIDRLFVTGAPLWGYAMIRILSHFLFMGIPLLLTLPIMALFFGIEMSNLAWLMVIVAVGLLSLTLLGSIGASLTLGARRSGILSAILFLPLAFPLLIFGTLASEALLQDADFMPHFLLLMSAGLVLLVISPLATLYALRFALEER